MELITRYFERYNEFSKLDDFNLEERTKQVINEKQFFLSEWGKCKIKLHQLKRKKSKLRDSATKKLLEKSPVALNKKSLDDIDNSPDFSELNSEIEDEELILSILDSIVKQISFIGTDIKNIIEITRINNG